MIQGTYKLIFVIRSFVYVENILWYSHFTLIKCVPMTSDEGTLIDASQVKSERKILSESLFNASE